MNANERLLLPLPAADLDTALMVYRHVNVEGYIVHRSNLYSVPWSHIGQESCRFASPRAKSIIYSVALEEIARHQLVPGKSRPVCGRPARVIIPADDPGQRTLLLQQRFHELGPVAVQFLDGLLSKQVQGKLQRHKDQAGQLLAHYQRGDVHKALERRAIRFSAFSLAARSAASSPRTPNPSPF